MFFLLANATAKVSHIYPGIMSRFRFPPLVSHRNNDTELRTHTHTTPGIVHTTPGAWPVIRGWANSMFYGVRTPLRWPCCFTINRLDLQQESPRSQYLTAIMWHCTRKGHANYVGITLAALNGGLRKRGVSRAISGGF